LDGAAHATGPAAPAPELAARDGDDLDPVPAQLRVGVDVALVGDDDAGRDSEHVVAVVPLLALGLELVAAGGQHADVLATECGSDLLEHRGAARDAHVRFARLDAPAPQRLDDPRVGHERLRV